VSTTLTQEQRNAEAFEILFKMELTDRVEEMQDHERKFIEDLSSAFEKYAERTFVSEKQLFWLRDLKDKYL
jgi:hypothetical protein